jgi:hypothetical protein
MTIKQYNLYNTENVFLKTIVMDDESSEELFDLIANENNGSRWEIYRHPQPWPSWTEDGDDGWKAPIEQPNDGKDYWWDELNVIWKEVSDS